MKKTYFLSLMCLLWLFRFSEAVAQLNPPFISQNYYQGVVKILLYDPVLEQTFKLKAGEGYMGRGSGFIVTENGTIFTNRHVVEQCVYGYVFLDYVSEGKTYEKQMLTYKPGLENDPAVTNLHYAGYAIPIVQVYTGQGENDYKLYIAEVLTLSESFDGAMIKIVSDIDGKPVKMPFKPVPIGDAETAKQGQRLCVFGYPAQYDGEMNTALKDLTTMTIGYHSGWDYVFNKDYGFIKTDASINSGNSGGPAFGESNRVIGIASAKGTKTNIGLVGGINGMYYVAAPKSDVLKNLITRGLKVPKRAGAIATITGEKRPIPDVKQWQANKRGGNDNTTRRTNTSRNNDNSALTITGTVIGVDSGSPLSGATIALLLPKTDNPKTMDDYEVLSAAKSDSDGTFSMTPTIKAGTYVFVAVSDGYESIVSKLEVAADNKSFNVKMARSR